MMCMLKGTEEGMNCATLEQYIVKHNSRTKDKRQSPITPGIKVVHIMLLLLTPSKRKQFDNSQHWVKGWEGIWQDTHMRWPRRCALYLTIRGCKMYYTNHVWYIWQYIKCGIVWCDMLCMMVYAMWCVVCYMLHVMYDMLHVMCEMCCLLCYVWHMIWYIVW